MEASGLRKVQCADCLKYCMSTPADVLIRAGWIFIGGGGAGWRCPLCQQQFLVRERYEIARLEAEAAS